MMATGIRLADTCQCLSAQDKKQYTHMPSDTTTYTQRGNRAKMLATAMQLFPNVYIVGAHALGTLSARSTVRKRPKPPSGESTAAMSPPTLLPPSKPVSQTGTFTADAAKTAPRKCEVT